MNCSAWGNLLLREIENCPIKEAAKIWHLGGPSLAIKSPRALIYVDLFTGGVFDPEGMNWRRLVVNVIDPEEIKHADAQLSTHDHYDPWFESLYLYGEKGVIHNIGELHVYSERDPRFASGFTKVSFGKTLKELWEESFEIEIEHFANCILKNEVPLTRGEECRRSLKVVLACYEAAKAGRVIKL